MSPKLRKALRFSLPFTAAITVGVLFSLAFGSWLGLISVLAGFPIGIVILMADAWRTRRKKMRTARPLLERLLDDMIAMVERPARPLEKIVFLNASDRRKDGALVRRLSLHGEPESYWLTTTEGRAGRLCVEARSRGPEKETRRVDYPELAGFADPEPWLAERLQKLRTLVGDVSGHDAM